MRVCIHYFPATELVYVRYFPATKRICSLSASKHLYAYCVLVLNAPLSTVFPPLNACVFTVFPPVRAYFHLLLQLNVRLLTVFSH